MDLAPAAQPYFRAGRLTCIPRRQAPRQAVLDTLANEFEPGVRYTEADVNEVLRQFHPDYCALRRYLVEADFLSRENGTYWRTGGSFTID